MKLKKSLHLSFVMLVAASTMTAVASAQDKASEKNATQIATLSHSERACFADNEPIADNLPKRPTKKSEQQIIDKIIRFVTHGNRSQELAFLNLDHDHNCKLDKSEVSEMLSKSHVNGLIRLFATRRLIDRYDVSDDGYVEWREFHFAMDKALKKQTLRKANKLRTSTAIAASPKK